MSELSKLRWRCRRGMRELDLLLMRYLDTYYETASATEQQAFQDLLEIQDPEIFSYLTGKQTAEDANVQRLAEQLRDFLR